MLPSEPTRRAVGFYENSITEYLTLVISNTLNRDVPAAWEFHVLITLYCIGTICFVKRTNLEYVCILNIIIPVELKSIRISNDNAMSVGNFSALSCVNVVYSQGV